MSMYEVMKKKAERALERALDIEKCGGFHRILGGDCYYVSVDEALDEAVAYERKAARVKEVEGE
jgi:hypothetical protein